MRPSPSLSWILSPSLPFRSRPARRRGHAFRPDMLERFEPRIVPDGGGGAVVAPAVATFFAEAANYYPDPQHPQVVSSVPTIMTNPDGSQSICISVTNTTGQAVVLGQATYTQGPTHYNADGFLQDQHLIDVSYQTVPAGATNFEVCFPKVLDNCYQADIFVHSVGGTVVQNAVPAFVKDNLNPNPPVNGGYFNSLTAYVADNNCPTGTGNLTQGYWKNHPDAWPVSGLWIGGQWIQKDTLINILNTPVKGNAVLIMVDQEIAAMLNIASGNDSDADVANAIMQANDTLLPGLITLNPDGTLKSIVKVDPSSPTGQQMVAIGSLLDAFNNRDE